MTIPSSYKVKLIGIYKYLFETAHIYQEAFAFVVPVVNDNWEDIINISGLKCQQRFVEKLIHNTESNFAKYDFDEKFPNFPSYLRRCVISDAIGHVSSYRSNYENWLKKPVGKSPVLSTKTSKTPVFYKDNMYKTVNGKIMLKVYTKKKGWHWITVNIRKQDVCYIQRRWSKTSAPKLAFSKNKAYLVFTVENDVKLSKNKNIAVGVDLGINSDAVLSAVRIDGTVLDRRFVNFKSEKARLLHLMHIASKIQRRSGYRSTRRLWEYISLLNRTLADKIAKAIVSFAEENGADVIVFEHLDMKSKKTKSQKIAMWRKNDIQKRTETKAHKAGIRISRICAWNTSKLAYDGSGCVKRDKDNYSSCTFSTGKRYNCDLSASYNIAARYFIREIDKTLSQKGRSDLEAKVPHCLARTSGTLHTLISINAAI